MNRLILFCLLTSTFIFCQEVEKENWRVSSKQSFISYKGKHILHEWSGLNKNIRGVLVLKNNQPTKIAILTAIKDFNSGNSGRDSHALEVLEVLLHPGVSFFGDYFTLKDNNFTISGKIAFHGLEKNVQIQGTWERKKEKIILKGEFDVKPTDFQIKLPDFMLVKIEDNLKIKYELIFIKE
ncbi:MAG: YceI family protein [Flavobacteriaceae bacterium]|nr:YceI family protein [Flavobacteriaceae bacterium]